MSPLTGPAVGKRLSPHLRIPVITRTSHANITSHGYHCSSHGYHGWSHGAPWLILTFTFAFTFTLAFKFTEAAAFCAAPSQVPPLVARGCLGRLSAHVSCSPCLWSMCTSGRLPASCSPCACHSPQRLSCPSAAPTRTCQRACGRQVQGRTAPSSWDTSQRAARRAPWPTSRDSP